MSRYTGPRLRKIRAFGADLPGLTAKRPSQKKQTPPGQHGALRLRSKSSKYKEQLVEKQKIRFNYGLTEKQLRRYFARASRMRGNTGENLMVLLEGRLDNMLYRAGFSPSIPASRQLIGHGHVRVNGHKVDVASYQVSPYDVIEIEAKSQQIPVLVSSIEKARSGPRPPFLEIDDQSRRFKVLALPTPQDVPLRVNAIAVVEFYSH